MAIWKLPTKGSQKYRGKYPARTRYMSASNGIVHIEHNNGDRFVALYSDFVDLPSYGKSMWDNANPQSEIIDMPREMYDTFKDSSDSDQRFILRNAGKPSY